MISACSNNDACYESFLVPQSLGPTFVNFNSTARSSPWKCLLGRKLTVRRVRVSRRRILNIEPQIASFSLGLYGYPARVVQLTS